MKLASTIGVVDFAKEIARGDANAFSVVLVYLLGLSLVLFGIYAGGSFLARQKEKPTLT